MDHKSSHHPKAPIRMRSAEDLSVVGYLDRQGKILVHVWNREYLRSTEYGVWLNK